MVWEIKDSFINCYFSNHIMVFLHPVVLCCCGSVCPRVWNVFSIRFLFSVYILFLSSLKYGCWGFRGAASAGRTAGSWDRSSVRTAPCGEKPPRDPTGRGEAAISHADTHLTGRSRRQSVRKMSHTWMQSDATKLEDAISFDTHSSFLKCKRSYFAVLW